MVDSVFLARPSQPLSDHLEGVVSNVQQLTPADAETPQGDPLQQVLTTIAELHDFGKLTPAFQQYIKEQPKRPPRESEYHAAPSAVVTLHALKSQGFSTPTVLAGFYAVLKHHQALGNLEEDLSKWATKSGVYSSIQQKFQAIDSEAPVTADKYLQNASNGNTGWEAIAIENTDRYRNAIQSPRNSEEAFSGFYPLVQRIWATLCCADKLDAAGIPLNQSVSRPDADQISFDSHASGITKQLNNLRSQAQTNVAERLDELGRGVFTLTLPTGFGKTFAGLNAALQHSSATGGRVIYALPYTTILDQIDGEIQSQFDVSQTSEVYTLHHHLAETRTKIDDESVSDGTETMYAETWQAGLVLTTFVQLFESLAGATNVQSLKIPALQDATIIIDEPQSLSQNWWRLATELIKTLVSKYNATVILMTATQPRFIEYSSISLNSTELVDDTEEYFEFLDRHPRVSFEIDESVPIGDAKPDGPISPQTAARRVVSQATVTDTDTLVISNTVQSAVELGTAIRQDGDNQSVLNLGQIVKQYITDHSDEVVNNLRKQSRINPLAAELIDLVDTELQDDPDVMTATLTAALRPIDRRLLIELIRRILETPSVDRVPLIVTSTQLVEAGIDVSFERVYRDFAPLPAVVQAAGRCNRSFEGDLGKVILWRLESRAYDRLPCQLVYARDGDRLTPTSSALAKLDHKTIIPEMTMLTDGVEQYYKELHATDHRDHSHDQLVDAYFRGQGKALRTASLIPDDSEDVLVVRTQPEWELLNSYIQAKKSQSHKSANVSFSALQKLFASVPSDRSGALDETERILRQCDAGSITLDEFSIVDDRNQSQYALTTGRGLREQT